MHHRVIALVLGLLTLVEIAFASPSSASPKLSEDEQTLWTLEHAYWRFVEKNDLAAYANLWNENFLGWPSVSCTPVHKEHITDWITTQTSKGLAFKFVEFNPAAIQVTGDIAAVCYWITFRWLDKDANGAPSTIRITHAWVRTENEWRIISGMSMPEPKPAAK
jgi:ketosteroid isomerase-like protein